MSTLPDVTALPRWAAEDSPAPVVTDAEIVVPVLRAGGVLVLTGAGISTDSGIPDYRGPNGRLRRNTPMHYDEFVGNAESRRRYWARAHLGWQAMRAAAPNEGHRAVAAWQAAGVCTGVITQNVDGLHQAAGSADVVELHGSLDRVVCLDCGARGPRAELEHRLAAANPGFHAEIGQINPDGDVELDEARVAEFRLVDCARCGHGTLKPDVVFFGENVPTERVRHCYRLVDDCAALLVLGSSLAVLSGLRFVRHAAKHGKPVYVITQGATRGDRHVTARIDAPLGQVLPELARALR